MQYTKVGQPPVELADVGEGTLSGNKNAGGSALTRRCGVLPRLSRRADRRRSGGDPLVGLGAGTGQLRRTGRDRCCLLLKPVEPPGIDPALLP
jgi:hypothetical protein